MAAQQRGLAERLRVEDAHEAPLLRAEHLIITIIIIMKKKITNNDNTSANTNHSTTAIVFTTFNRLELP